MKPTHPKFFRILRLTILIPALLPFNTQAAIIGDNAEGNVQPTLANNGANTIIADGGTSANPLVNIITGVELQGDIARTAVLEISAPNYIVYNRGKLIGTNHTGIHSDFWFNLTNYNTITGSTNGISATDSASVTNYSNSSISGSNVGVWLNDNASVANNGNITGTNIGLRVGDNSEVINYSVITGNIGIDADTDLNGTFTLINRGRITGSAGIAIDGGSGVDTLNLYYGSIINGGINLMEGSDSIHMGNGPWLAIDLGSTGFAADQSVVIGNIDGGTGTDVLTFDGGKTISYSLSIMDAPKTNEVRGNVINMEDIIKNGDGTAFIGEVGGALRTVRTDAIHVNSGGLYINGNVDGTQASQTSIANDGSQLGGTGTWDANITLTGSSIISPGQTPLNLITSATRVADSLGVLSVTGNVSLGSTAAYQWNTTPGSSSDLIVLTDAINTFTTNNSNFVISPTNVNRPLQDGSTVVVDTEATLGGAFGSISLASFTGSILTFVFYPPPITNPITNLDTGSFLANHINPILTENFTTLRKINSDQDWELTIQHDYSQFGTTPNQIAAGEMLNSLVGSATGDIADLLAALDYSDAQTTINTLSAFDPSSYLATVPNLATKSHQLHRRIETHNAAVRSDAGAMSAPDTTIPKERSNVWGSFSYDWLNLHTSTSGFDQTGDTAAFTAGIDYRMMENLSLGFVAEGSQTSWNAIDSPDSLIDSYNLATYSNWGAATGWFVDALLGYNTHSVDQSRGTIVGGIYSSEATRYDADGMQGLVSGGYAVQTSSGLFSPFIAFEWQQLSADSYDNGALIPVSVDSTDIDSFRNLVGIRWEAIIANNITGYASAAYAYEFQGDAPTTTVSFGGSSYTAKGIELSDYVLISAGMRWKIMPNTTADFGYRGEFAMNDGVDSNSANIGVNYSF